MNTAKYDITFYDESYRNHDVTETTYFITPKELYKLLKEYKKYGATILKVEKHKEY